MEKILLHLAVPAIEKEYDVFVPAFLTVAEVTELLIRAVLDLSGNNYRTSGGEVLCLKERDLILDKSREIQTYGIQNGDIVVMI